MTSVLDPNTFFTILKLSPVCQGLVYAKLAGQPMSLPQAMLRVGGDMCCAILVEDRGDAQGEKFWGDMANNCWAAAENWLGQVKDLLPLLRAIYSRDKEEVQMFFVIKGE